MNIRAIVLVLMLLATVSLEGCIETGRGSSVDTIYGCELQGLVWKTWSCWLTNDHPSKGSDGNDYTAIYSVDKQDTELIQQIQSLSANGTKTKVYYRNELLYFPWDYSSGTIIYKVEVKT